MVEEKMEETPGEFRPYPATMLLEAERQRQAQISELEGLLKRARERPALTQPEGLVFHVGDGETPQTPFWACARTIAAGRDGRYDHRIIVKVDMTPLSAGEEWTIHASFGRDGGLGGSAEWKESKVWIIETWEKAVRDHHLGFRKLGAHYVIEHATEKSQAIEGLRMFGPLTSQALLQSFGVREATLISLHEQGFLERKRTEAGWWWRLTEMGQVHG